MPALIGTRRLLLLPRRRSAASDALISDANALFYAPFTSSYNDRSSAARSATLVGTPSRTDRLITPDVDSYVHYPWGASGLDSATEWCVEFRLKATALNAPVDGGVRVALMFGSTRYEIGIFQYNGHLAFYNRPQVGDSVIWTTAATVNDGVEHHCALVWTGANYYWFIGDAPGATGTRESIGGNATNFLSSASSFNKLALLHAPPDGTQGVVAEIDDVRISNLQRYTGATYTVPARGYGY